MDRDSSITVLVEGRDVPEVEGRCVSAPKVEGRVEAAAEAKVGGGTPHGRIGGGTSSLLVQLPTEKQTQACEQLYFEFLHLHPFIHPLVQLHLGGSLGGLPLLRPVLLTLCMIRNKNSKISNFN